MKRYSVTTSAGAKVQPYFDVPPPSDPHLYYFHVQGRVVDDGVVEVWITRNTAKFLESTIGRLDADELSRRILGCKGFLLQDNADGFVDPFDIAVPVKISLEAYQHLRGQDSYASDEQMFQLFARQIAGKS